MFSGMYTALITPFKSAPVEGSEIDYRAFEDLIEWQLECKVNGFVICGTTGESATLKPEEKLSLMKKAVDVVNGSVPVIAGTGHNCTKDAIELTRAARELNVDGILSVSPYYNKPTQEGLYQHFSTIASQGGLPVIIYNIPGRTSVDISLETFERLSKLDNVVGVKEASGNADKLMELSVLVGDKLDLLSGEDALTYLFMAVGGKGVISAAGNVIPELMVAITDNAASGNYEAALRAQQQALPVIRALFAETSPAPSKEALVMMKKIPSAVLRLPLVPVTEKTRARLSAVLK